MKNVKYKQRQAKPVRLRDFVKFKNCYFSVVSYKNENGIKCLLRYIDLKLGLSSIGIRSESISEESISEISKNINKNIRRGYIKLTHSESLNFFKEYQMDGIFILPDVNEILKPEELTSEICKVDDKVRKVSQFFSFIPETHRGVTGSRLLRLNSENSDVDFVVYGNYWFKAREALKKGIELGKLKQPSEEVWEKIYKKRKPTISYDAFIAHELRKYNRAVLDDNIYFDLLYVRDYPEILGFLRENLVPNSLNTSKTLKSNLRRRTLNRKLQPFFEKKGKKIGFAEIECEICDDSFIFDYPAFYPVKNVIIKELNLHEEINKADIKVDIYAILSFTHTYIGQAFKGEKVRAYGCLEQIDGKIYLIIGTMRESDEYLVSLDLLNYCDYRL